MALQKKPPVVTIMGHVDHGKTTLLDFIRKTKLAAKEVGEITQSIGAYQVEFEGRRITFIDTPGHETFSAMRARGAKVADLVVLVVAANDGVMSQTKESIKIINETKTPFLVAISKIDLPEASVEKTKVQLAEAGVLVEGYGGKIVSVPVSAKTGEGVDQLLELILLTADLEDLQADPEGELEAFVIEAKADRLRGPVVSLIVQNGTLKKGDTVQAGKIFAKVKMLQDEWGKTKNEGLPGDPVQVLGFSSLPEVGSIITRPGKIVNFRPEPEIKDQSIVKIDKEENVLKIILKTDVAGSLEAIANFLPEKVLLVRKLVGDITESDVLLAKTLGAEIYGFNLNVSTPVKKLAETEKVRVVTHRIIYDLLKELDERAAQARLGPIRKILGQAEILAVFEIKGERIIGGRVIEGKIRKGGAVLIKRGEVEIGETKIISLKEQKQDINEASEGGEFGAILADKLDFQKGDMLISYILEDN